MFHNYNHSNQTNHENHNGDQNYHSELDNQETIVNFNNKTNGLNEVCKEEEYNVNDGGGGAMIEEEYVPRSSIGNGPHIDYFPSINKLSNNQQIQESNALSNESNEVKNDECGIDLNLIKAESVDMPSDLLKNDLIVESMDVTKTDNLDDKLTQKQEFQTPVLNKKTTNNSSLTKSNNINNSANPSSPSLSSNKKRKAPANESNTSSNTSSNPTSTPISTQSTTNSLTQPPSAKRKMTTPNTPLPPPAPNGTDFKRHTSLIDESSLNSTQSDLSTPKSNQATPKSAISNSSMAKKPKLKSSLSSVDLSSSTPKSENSKKIDVVKQNAGVSNSSSGTNKGKEGNNGPFKNNSSSNKEPKLINSTNKTPGSSGSGVLKKPNKPVGDPNTTPVIKQNPSSNKPKVIHAAF